MCSQRRNRRRRYEKLGRACKESTWYERGRHDSRNETENKRIYTQFLTFLIKLNNLQTIVPLIPKVAGNKL
jgi:hypothetical protein